MPPLPQETNETAMTRVRWIQDGGKEILFIDLRQATLPESLAAQGAFVREMQSRPENSVLVLTDVTACAYDSSVSTRWKTEGLAHARLIRGSAIFGISGMVGLALRGLIEVLRIMGLGRTGDKVKLFKTRSEALAWLQQR